MKEAILSTYFNASKDLIEDVFHLSYFDNSDLHSFFKSSSEQKDTSIFRFKTTFDNVNFILYTGFTDKAMEFFLENSFDGLKQLKSEIVPITLFTNIAGMILFRLQDNFRDKTEHIEYCLHEEQDIIQCNNLQKICSGYNGDSLILFFGFVIV